MKLNLLMYSDNVLAGYRNIDPYPKFQSEQTFSAEKETGDVQNLDRLVDDGECEEIVALDIIDFVASNLKHQVIDNWIKKLAHGGKLTIGGHDLYSTAKALIVGTLSLDDSRSILYGDSTFAFGNRRTLFEVNEIVELLKSKGLVIASKHLQNNKYVISAVRP